MNSIEGMVALIRKQCQMDMEHREIYFLLMHLLGIVEEQQKLIAKQQCVLKNLEGNVTS